jgi:hypothetical protein
MLMPAVVLGGRVCACQGVGDWEGFVVGRFGKEEVVVLEKIS